MLKTIATVFGAVMLAVGVLGFVPATTPDGMLFGVFQVNTAYNMIHLATGAVALWIGLASPQYARLYFQTFGVVYGLVALLGFFTQGDHILGVIANNPADNWLHVAISGIALAVGFGVKDEEATTVTRT